MTMFHWHSHTLENYARGHIIVEAETVEEARQIAREELTLYARHWDDDDDYRREYLDKIEADLAPEPTIHTIILIHGSE